MTLTGREIHETVERENRFARSLQAAVKEVSLLHDRLAVIEMTNTSLQARVRVLEDENTRLKALLPELSDVDPSLVEECSAEPESRE